LLEQRNSKKQGNVGLGEAIAFFTRMGITVSVPLTDAQEYDLVVDIGGVLKKVQVRTSLQLQNGKYKVDLRTKGGNQSWNRVVRYFQDSHVDLLFALTGDGKAYCIPAGEIDSRSCLNPGSDKYAQYEVAQPACSETAITPVL
jgi:hypothetical protein